MRRCVVVVLTLLLLAKAQDYEQADSPKYAHRIVQYDYGRLGIRYCRRVFFHSCVGWPRRYHASRLWCPVQPCYWYKEVAPCPRSDVSSTHKCAIVEPERTEWKCVKGVEKREMYLWGAKYPVLSCACYASSFRYYVYAPREPYVPKCYA